MTDRIAAKEYYSIGEVCEITDLKPHVLRYWESQFPILNPTKNAAGNRVYRRREIKLIQLLRHVLYSEKYTIEGARGKLDQLRKHGKLAKAWKDPTGCKDIARQLIEFPFGDGIEVAMGGGRRHFQPNTMADSENPNKKTMTFLAGPVLGLFLSASASAACPSLK